MVRVTKTPKVVEKQPRVKKSEEKESGNQEKFSLKALGKLIREAREVIWQANQVRKDTKTWPYQFHPGEKAL